MPYPSFLPRARRAVAALAAGFLLCAADSADAILERMRNHIIFSAERREGDGGHVCIFRLDHARDGDVFWLTLWRNPDHTMIARYTSSLDALYPQPVAVQMNHLTFLSFPPATSRIEHSVFGAFTEAMDDAESLQMLAQVGEPDTLEITGGGQAVSIPLAGWKEALADYTACRSE